MRLHFRSTHCLDDKGGIKLQPTVWTIFFCFLEFGRGKHKRSPAFWTPKLLESDESEREWDGLTFSGTVERTRFLGIESVYDKLPPTRRDTRVTRTLTLDAEMRLESN